jgi:hypothetical protein
MDTIEQTLVDIEAQMEDAITKQKLTVANTIHNVARDSVHAGYSLDMEFMNVFPEMKDLLPDVKPTESASASAFNPRFVIEVRNGQGVGVIEQWDSTEGLLPNRKVMGKYYIDVGKPYIAFVHSANNMYCITHNTCTNNFSSVCLHTNSQPSTISINCGCGNFYNNIANHMYGVSKGSIETSAITRGEHRDLFDSTTTHEFEVDNYLNLYRLVWYLRPY